MLHMKINVFIDPVFSRNHKRMFNISCCAPKGRTHRIITETFAITKYEKHAHGLILRDGRGKKYVDDSEQK